MTLTKADLVEAVFKEIGGTRGRAIDAVEMVFETMKKVLERGERLKISGFGSFNPRDKKTRVGRNPKTGDAIQISARRVVTFKASPVLKERINSKE